jgi:hypothetical protein
LGDCGNEILLVEAVGTEVVVAGLEKESKLEVAAETIGTVLT